MYSNDKLVSHVMFPFRHTCPKGFVQGQMRTYQDTNAVQVEHLGFTLRTIIVSCPRRIHVTCAKVANDHRFRLGLAEADTQGEDCRRLGTPHVQDRCYDIKPLPRQFFKNSQATPNTLYIQGGQVVVEIFHEGLKLPHREQAEFSVQWYYNGRCVRL